jgi:hypothetical protein
LIADTEGFKLTVVLCDAAQAVGGKLYILGGGWSRVFTFQPPVVMALAVTIAVPWTLANQRFDLAVRLLDDNNRPVTLPEQPGPVEVRGQIEAGRPAGLPKGTPLDSSFAVSFSLPLEPGIYVWETSIVGHVIDTTRFEVVRGQLPSLPPGLPPGPI